MKLAKRAVFAFGLICAALLGGLMATVFAPYFAPRPVAAAPMGALAFGPPVKVTAMAVPIAYIEATDSFAKIGDIGPFTVENAASLVEVTHQGRLVANEFLSGSQVIFELRIDGLSPLPNTGQWFIRDTDTSYVPATFSGYWQGLPAGTHTVSLWARTISGTATPIMNPGNFTTNDVIVKEYLPFGSTYVPLIVR